MKRAVLALAPVFVGLAACSATTARGAPTVVSSETPPTERTVVQPPPTPRPATDEKCPYLESSFVASANGQKVGKVSISADKPNPACFFYRPDGNQQLSTQVYVGDPNVAKALVDRSAPIETSNRAELSDGWTGGAQPTDNGAVFAVAKDGTAVVVTTNQKQTIKAKQVAEKVISALGL